MNEKPARRNPKLFLAGDIGGTKTLLALADENGQVRCERRYASRDYADFTTLLRDFLRDFLREAGNPAAISAACFGVAGPVDANRSKVTNLPWLIDGPMLEQAFDIGRVELLNDFAAAAQGIDALSPDDLVALQIGAPLDKAPRVIIGAGTGLGVVGLLWADGNWRSLASEGGHMGFAPTDEEQLALWRFITQRHGRASAERVLSGGGLTDIYRHLLHQSGGDDRGGIDKLAAISHDPDPLLADDPAAQIGGIALQKPHSLAAQAVALFSRIYGAYAGDMALLFMARGGVYVAGGIAPKLLPLLASGGFMTAFAAKAEHARLMPDFPVQVVVNEGLGLLGALHVATHLAAHD